MKDFTIQTETIQMNGHTVGMSYEEIAKELKLTVKQVKVIEASALRKLKTPKNAKTMKTYITM